MRLTENFTLEELTRSQTATRNGINNRPDTQQLINLVHTANTLQQVRALFNKSVIVSSGFRCDELNRRIGGSKNSYHTKGLAVDFTVSGFSVDEVFATIKASNIKYSQLINEFDRWIHLAIPAIGDTPKQTNLLALKIDGNTTYRNAA